jgi:hypothetical protein
MTLNSGEDYLGSASSILHGYAYFGTWTSPGKVIKVDITRRARLAVSAP